MKPIPASVVEAFRRDRNQYQSAKALLDGINTTREALEKGTYVENPQYGKWGTIWVSSTSMKDSGVSWVDTTFGLLPRFATGNFMQGVLQIPAEFSSPGTWVPSLAFTFGSPTYAGEVVYWALKINTMAPPKGTFAGGVEATVAFTPGASDGKQHHPLRMPLRALSLPPGSVMVFRVTRQTGAAITNNPYLLGVSWAFQKKKFGLEEEP